jgi:hypothetical protein
MIISIIDKASAFGRNGLARTTIALLAALALLASPGGAQDLQSFDPDEAYSSEGAASPEAGAIDADLAQPGLPSAAPLDEPVPVPPDAPGPATVVTSSGAADGSGFSDEFAQYADSASAESGGADGANSAGLEGAVAQADASQTYGKDDLIGAAEGVFGKGAEGLARLIEDLLRDQGEPNGYIVGREAGGAFVFGARYGSGTLFHSVEGERKVYWTGPSLGLDAGANAGNTFVLVYNLYDTEDLYKRFPAGEGQAYLIGGLHASYMRRGDIVLIPIRMGAGLRLGVNAGYMKFSKKQRWLPF